MVMKFCGWIDLINGECSAHEPELLLAEFLSFCPLFFTLKFCSLHVSKTILAMAMKFHGWLQLGVRWAYLATIYHSCFCAIFLSVKPYHTIQSLKRLLKT